MAKISQNKTNGQTLREYHDPIAFATTDAPNLTIREIAKICVARKFSTADVFKILGYKSASAVTKVLEQGNPQLKTIAKWCFKLQLVPEHWYLVETNPSTRDYIEQKLLPVEWRKGLEDMLWDELSEFNGFTKDTRSKVAAVLGKHDQRARRTLVSEYALARYRSRFVTLKADATEDHSWDVWWDSHPALREFAARLRKFGVDLFQLRSANSEHGWFSQILFGLAYFGVNEADRSEVRNMIHQVMESNGEEVAFEELDRAASENPSFVAYCHFLEVTRRDRSRSNENIPENNTISPNRPKDCD